MTSVVSWRRPPKRRVPNTKCTLLRDPQGRARGVAASVARPRAAPGTPSPAAFSSAISTSMIFEPTSFDIQELDVEDERRVRGNHAACALCAIAKLRRDGERALSADSHAGYALVPPGNHLARAETERKRLVAITPTVELASLVIGPSLVVQPAGVVHLYLPSRYGLRPSASLGVLPHQLSDIRMSHVVSATRSQNAAEQKSHSYRSPGAHRTPRTSCPCRHLE